MARRTSAIRENSSPNSRKDEAVRLLGKLGRDGQKAFTYSLDVSFFPGEHAADRFILYKVREIGNYFRDVGIEAGDVLVIDTSITESAEKNAIVCSVVTDPRYVDDEFVDFEREADFGRADILDAEFLHSEAAKPSRKRKGDNPQIKREILGIVTTVCRDVSRLKPIAGPTDERMYFEG